MSGAEGEGFEPSNTCVLLVFKTSAIGHSAIPPDAPRDGASLVRLHDAMASFKKHPAAGVAPSGRPEGAGVQVRLDRALGAGRGPSGLELGARGEWAGDGPAGCRQLRNRHRRPTPGETRLT